MMEEQIKEARYRYRQANPGNCRGQKREMSEDFKSFTKFGQTWNIVSDNLHIILAMYFIWHGDTQSDAIKIYYYT